MSYILEALKKADAEREKGSVPGLHSQAWMPDAVDTSPRLGFQRRRWALSIVVVLAMGLALWFWRKNVVTAESSVAKPSIISAGAALPPLPPATVASAVPAPAPIALVAPPAVAPVPAPLVQPVAKPRAAKPSASASSASDRVVKWADLGLAEQQKLPKLKWGGAMYSPDPSSRMVILNDQVMREGDPISPGLVLERIDAKSLILNQHGQRIRWDF